MAELFRPPPVVPISEDVDGLVRAAVVLLVGDNVAPQALRLDGDGAFGRTLKDAGSPGLSGAFDGLFGADVYAQEAQDQRSSGVPSRETRQTS